jgi:hypothetical protein
MGYPPHTEPTCKDNSREALFSPFDLSFFPARQT